jgi:hypothetical protein
VRLTAIVTSHANERGLRSILGNLLYQTCPPDEILAFCSDTPDLLRLREDFPSVLFAGCENENDWGHAKRALGVVMAQGEWLGFFNDDDEYANDYIEKMLAAGGDNDVVYCAWNEQPLCHFHLGSSTSGNFIIRTELAQRVGYRHRAYEADGLFIEDVKNASARVARVDEILYTHR